MSHSWLNNSQNSTGFMYYSLEDTEIGDSDNTPDFLSFGECNPSPQAQRFNPPNYSSPYKNRRGSPRNFIKRGWKHDASHQNTSRSPNNNFKLSPNSSWNRSRDDSYQSYKSRNGSYNKSRFLHPSFTEDPWAALEKQLDDKDRIEEKKKDIAGMLNSSVSSRTPDFYVESSQTETT